MKLSFVAPVCLALFTQVFAGAFGPAPKPPAILLVPARHSLVQLGRDFVDREGVLLMTYALETPAAEPHLHVWSGTEWIQVRAPLFSDGTFLRVKPSKVMVVGEANALTAGLIERASGWTEEVLHFETGNVTELVNRLGRVFAFRQGDWQWFARRYDLKLEDLNTEARKRSWYDTTRPEDIPPATNPLRGNAGEPTPNPVIVEPASLTPVVELPAGDAVPSEAEPENFSFETP